MVFHAGPQITSFSRCESYSSIQNFNTNAFWTIKKFLYILIAQVWPMKLIFFAASYLIPIKKFLCKESFFCPNHSIILQPSSSNNFSLWKYSSSVFFIWYILLHWESQNGILPGAELLLFVVKQQQARSSLKLQRRRHIPKFAAAFFLAVQNSSIGDLVTHSLWLTDSLSDFWFWHYRVTLETWNHWDI